MEAEVALVELHDNVEDPPAWMVFGEGLILTVGAAIAPCLASTVIYAFFSAIPGQPKNPLPVGVSFQAFRKV